MYTAEGFFKKALIFSFILHGILLFFLEGRLSHLPSAAAEVFSDMHVTVALVPPSPVLEEKAEGPAKEPLEKESPLEEPVAAETAPVEMAEAVPAVVNEIPPVEKTVPVEEAPAVKDIPAVHEKPDLEAASPASEGAELIENPLPRLREPSFTGERLDGLTFDNARMPVPSYPSRAKTMEWEGDVTVSFVINKKGRVESLVIEESSGYEMLDKSVADTVKKGWRFPRRDESLRVWKTFSFRLI